MVDRAKVNESVQIGLELTDGTPVVAPKNIRSVTVETGIGGASEFFRPDGRKFNVLSTLNQEWSTFTINGKATYTEILYLIEMMYGHPAASNSGVAVKTRVYTIDDTAAIVPQTMTIMQGSAVRAQQIAGALLVDHTMVFGRKSGITITGNGIGRLYTDGITMTASPADVALIPLVGKHLDIYIDTTAAGLGGTKLLRAFSLENALTGVFGPVWPINSANSSFDGHVDLAPATSSKLKLEADATGMSFLSQFRADDQMFIRIEATGEDVETGIPHLFRYDTCVGIKSVGANAEEDGITTVDYDMEMVRDSTWAKALNITVRNGIVTL